MAEAHVPSPILRGRWDAAGSENLACEESFGELTGDCLQRLNPMKSLKGCRGLTKGETGADWKGREVAQGSWYSEDGKAGHVGKGPSNRQAERGDR